MSRQQTGLKHRTTQGAPRRKNSKRQPVKAPAGPDFPRNGTPPDRHGFPHYQAIARGNRALRRDYKRTLAGRRRERIAAMARLQPAAWRSTARRWRAGVADSLGVRLAARPDPVAAPAFVRAASLVPDGVSTWSAAQFTGSMALGTWHCMAGAGLDGGDIELLTLKCPAVGGPYPTILWLPRAGDGLTGAQSPESAAREFGHRLAEAGWLVAIPRLPAFELFSILQSKRRVLEGTTALGAVTAEAARALSALDALPGRRREPVWVGGADIGGLSALMLGALDRRVGGVAAMELPRLGDSTVHESLILPRFNQVADLTALAALVAPRGLLLDRAQPLLAGTALPPLFRRLGGLSAFGQLSGASEVLSRLAAIPAATRRRPAKPPARADLPGAVVAAKAPPARQFDIRLPENRRLTLKHGEQRREHLRRVFREQLGIPAPRPPRTVGEVSRVRLPDCTRIEYHIETEPHCIVNLTWLRPHGFDDDVGPTPLATVLCLPGSSSDVGKVEAAYGHEVVRRGWNAVIVDARVALYPFHPGIAERRAMIAQSVHDLLTCCQWVFKQPGIDPTRVGCMGVSQGGTHSWMLPALEPRIAAAAPVCGVCTYKSLIDNVRDERYDNVWRSFLDSHSIYYFVPGVLEGFEQQDLCALIAPRPLAMIGADHDNCFPLDGMREAAADLQAWYRMLGAGKNFRYVEFQGEHSMPRHSRETAYDFLARAFARSGR